MGMYRVEWDCCGDATETEAWEPTECPFCELSNAEKRIEALEWLVEVQALKVHRVIHAGEWAQKNAGPSVREAWRRRENSNHELRDTLKSARDAVGL